MRAEGTVNSAAAQLRQPRRFLAGAVEDLGRSGAIGWRLFAANLRARHRRMFLGYLWLILPTLVMTGIWVFLQSRRVIDFGPVGMPYVAYVLSGMLLWQLFVDALNAPLAQLAAGKTLVTRSIVPLEALVAAGALDAVLNFSVRVLLFVPILFVLGMSPSWTLALVPFAALPLALLGLVLGVALAPLGLLYGDVDRSIPIVTGAWFFLTPVVYRTPADGILRLNPVTPPLDAARQWLTTGGGDVSGPAAVIALQGALLLPMLVAALLFLRLARPHLAARLA
jgi:lipopolysaccharide transport system permease protein